jgi:hypothetical protein
MKNDYAVADAAFLVDLPETHVRSWIQRSLLLFGYKTETGRLRFTDADIFGLALMRELVRYGQSPNVAAHQSKALLIRVGAPPMAGLSAVCSLEPNQSATVVPTASVPGALGKVRLVIDLTSIWEGVNARTCQLNSIHA